jgi:hypothetical protein
MYDSYGPRNHIAHLRSPIVASRLASPLPPFLERVTALESLASPFPFHLFSVRTRFQDPRRFRPRTHPALVHMLASSRSRSTSEADPLVLTPARAQPGGVRSTGARRRSRRGTSWINSHLFSPPVSFGSTIVLPCLSRCRMLGRRDLGPAHTVLSCLARSPAWVRARLSQCATWYPLFVRDAWLLCRGGR